MRKVVFIISFSFSVSYSYISGDIKVCAIRIEFISDSLESTTGNGKFLLHNEGIDCGQYSIDSPPHQKSYFESQLKAVDNYYRDISNFKFGFDLTNSRVFPNKNDENYQLDQTMNYYNPYNSEIEQERNLTILFKDALIKAYEIDSIDFNYYDMIVIFHAGIGQDFSLPFLDPTPEDIPSTYIDNNMIESYLGTEALTINGNEIHKGIILPETQNHLLYDISLDMFNTSEPCDYQYGLTGTFALMVGFFIGLPPLWNINTGESGVGIFGLMDQGSNNGRGLIPARPTAWTRIFAGWDDSDDISLNTYTTLYDNIPNQIGRVDINESEYFLIENRNNYVHNNVSIDSMIYEKYEFSGFSRVPPFVEILFDSVDITKDSNGVVVDVPDYDLGLPSSGLLIWHIDETIIETGISDYSINSNINRPGVDLEEADGAQDIGKESFFLFNDPSSGYFGDMWFKGNLEYERANPSYEGFNLDFGPYTYPNTNDNNRQKSGITIGNIGYPSDSMSFIVKHDLIMNGFNDTTANIRVCFDLNSDGINEIIGGKDSLWWSSASDTLQKRNIIRLDTSSIDISFGFTYKGDTTYMEVREFFEDFTKITNLKYLKFIDDFIVEPVVYVNDFHITVHNDFYGDIDTLTASEWDSHKRKVYFKSSFNYEIPPSGYGISVNNFNNQPPKHMDKRFISLSAVDLNLDGSLNLLALTDNAHLYAFDSELMVMAGFPIELGLKEPILAGDITGQSFPEIVAKSIDGKTINIFNHQGTIIDRFINPVSDNLVSLAIVNNYSSIISKFSVYKIEEKNIFGSNSWANIHGNSGRSRTVELDGDAFANSHSLYLRGYCYPNPIQNDIGIIRVETNNAQNVTVSIYDYAGFFIEEFKKNNILPGVKISEWTWDVSSLNAGLYFGNVTVRSKNSLKSNIIKIAIIR